MVCFLTGESHYHLLIAKRTDLQRRKKPASFDDLPCRARVWWKFPEKGAEDIIASARSRGHDPGCGQ